MSVSELLSVNVVRELTSAIEVRLTCNIEFLLGELQRYGIKTKKEVKGKTVFFQSAHLLEVFDIDEPLNDPTYFLVSFKDLFTLVGRNDEGADEQDRNRVALIASKLVDRGMIITDQEIKAEFSNLVHIHKNAKDVDDFIYQTKFSTNRCFPAIDGEYNLICSGKHYILV